MMENITSIPLPTDCVTATFIARTKRFFVELEKDGKKIWAHTNNTGAMRGLPGVGAKALLSRARNPARKLPYTLERIYDSRQPGPGFWIGVNTSMPNRMLEAAFQQGQLAFASGYTRYRRESRWGKSRFDACMENTYGQRLWVECKNVSLVEECVALFPDAPSERARKHLQELMEIVREGERAAMFYAVQRPDASCFAPATAIDPDYARLFYEALDKGVEAYAYELRQDADATRLGAPLRICV